MSGKSLLRKKKKRVSFHQGFWLSSLIKLTVLWSSSQNQQIVPSLQRTGASSSSRILSASKESKFPSNAAISLEEMGRSAIWYLLMNRALRSTL